VDGAGGIHLALEPVSVAADGRLPVQYAYCATDCLRREGWQVVAVGDAGLPGAEVRLALAATGKPRLLWFAQKDWRKEGQYLFASCDRACTRAANWRSVAVATDSVGEGEGRYFALDANGNPHFLYTSTQTGHTGAFHRYCLGSCLSAQNWREQKVGDGSLFGSFSLAFDAQNRLRLALSAEKNSSAMSIAAAAATLHVPSGSGVGSRTPRRWLPACAALATRISANARPWPGAALAAC
jgi:hypothetical protein